jgi:hypothetical protein
MTAKKVMSEERDLSGPARLALKLGNIAHAGVYRATGGRLFGRMGKNPLLLLERFAKRMTLYANHADSAQL